MARIKFTADFDYKPTRRCTIAYKAGMELVVKRACAEQAISAGKAVEVMEKPRGENDGAE